MFGSFAKGDMLPRHMAMNSDIDLLVITAGKLEPAIQEALVNDTYPLYLECGRQISPQFWSTAKLMSPQAEAAVAFKQRVLADGAPIFLANAASES